MGWKGIPGRYDKIKLTQSGQQSENFDSYDIFHRLNQKYVTPISSFPYLKRFDFIKLCYNIIHLGLCFSTSSFHHPNNYL